MSFIRAILTNFDFYFDQNGNNNQAMDTEEDEENDPDYIPAEVGESHHHHASEERSDEEAEHHTPHEDETSSESSESFFTDDDDDDESPLDLFAPASGPLPIYPPHPHLLFPDYAFLSAARLVVAENLRERYGGGSNGETPMWPWFTTSSAVEATREILLRMGIPLLKANESSEQEDDMDSDDAGGASGDEEITQLSWESLRMGSAPGFWEGRGTAEGWTGVKDEEEKERPEMAAPWKRDESLEYIDGWDWAGAEGKWM